MDILLHLEEDTLLNWIKRFRELVNIFFLNDKLALTFLRARIHESLWDVVSSKTTPDTVLYALLGKTFTAEKIHIHRKMLNKPRQDKFPSIRQYTEALIKHCLNGARPQMFQEEIKNENKEHVPRRFCNGNRFRNERPRN